MKEELKKELEKLLINYPELKNRQLFFSELTSVFIPENESLPTSVTENTIPHLTCESEGLKPETIKGASSKIEVRKSVVHGYGVFAKEAIEEGELIEQNRLLPLAARSKYTVDAVLKDYVWMNKSCQCDECKKHGYRQYLALGFGSLYNHANEPNTKQDVNFQTEIITIKAGRQIKQNDEIFVNYGKSYWVLREFWGNITDDTLERLIKKIER